MRVSAGIEMVPAEVFERRDCCVSQQAGFGVMLCVIGCGMGESFVGLMKKEEMSWESLLRFATIKSE